MRKSISLRLILQILLVAAAATSGFVAFTAQQASVATSGMVLALVLIAGLIFDARRQHG